MEAVDILLPVETWISGRGRLEKRKQSLIAHGSLGERYFFAKICMSLY
jgi:hypothetical protein